MDITKDVLATIRIPIAYFVGGTDIANPNTLDDFNRIEKAPVFFGSLSIPGDAHAGTFRQVNGGQFAPVGLAWLQLQWHLKSDVKAARMFRGANCGLCSNPKWEVKKRLID